MKKLGPKTKAALGPTKRNPMKPVKAWALVGSDNSVICYPSHPMLIYTSRRIAASESLSGERIARVEIREVGR